MKPRHIRRLVMFSAGLLAGSGVLSGAPDGEGTAAGVVAPTRTEDFEKQDLPSDFYATFAAGLIRLDTPEGIALLDSGSPDYAPIRGHWVKQLKSHCGAASSVIVMNSLLPGAGFTQDSIFNPSTADIIQQETVYRIGFTLDELTRMIRATSGLRAELFHAGEGEGEHGYEAWIAALKANRPGARDRIICNFSTRWLAERKNGGGHFSPVADYNEAKNKVLIFEVSGARPSFWVDARELWAAMNQVDTVSTRVRGWIVVSRG